MLKLENVTYGRVGAYRLPATPEPGAGRGRRVDAVITRGVRVTLLDRLLRVPAWMYRGYTESNATDMAAAVAFNTLVALVPMFLLVITISGLFLKNEDVVIQARQVIDRLVPVDSAPTAFEAAIGARNNTGVLGLISFFGFAWVGTGFVSCLARSMNKIYRVKSSGYLNEKQRGFFVLFIFSLLFIVSLGTTIVTTFFVNQELPSFFRTWALAKGQAQVIGYSIGFLSAMLLFTTIYRVVPNAGQKLLDVWPGALLAAVLFVSLTQIFPIYVRLGGGNAYGQVLGLVSLLVFSLLVLAHVILFGAYTNASWQRRRRNRDRLRRVDRASREQVPADDDPLATAPTAARATSRSRR